MRSCSRGWGSSGANVPHCARTEEELPNHPKNANHPNLLCAPMALPPQDKKLALGLSRSLHSARGSIRVIRCFRVIRQFGSSAVRQFRCSAVPQNKSGEPRKAPRFAMIPVPEVTARCWLRPSSPRRGSPRRTRHDDSSPRPDRRARRRRQPDGSHHSRSRPPARGSGQRS